jgi:catechol-2,3-dioxygenase
MAQIEAQSFNHVALWVSDIRKSADWYIEHLGLEEASASGNHIFLRLESGEVLALFQASDPAQIGVGLHHIALNLPSGQQEQALESLRQRDIPLERRGPSLSFQDPDGYWIHFSG